MILEFFLLYLFTSGKRSGGGAEGRTPKFVRCEDCGNDYVYMLERSVTAQGSTLLGDEASLRAQLEGEARNKLERVLAMECDPIPCPICGHIQKYMYREARRQRWLWSRLISRWCLVLTPVFCLLALLGRSYHHKFETNGSFTVMALLYVLSATTIAGAILLPLVRWISNAMYDPNLVPLDRRLDYAKSNSWSRAEYEAILNERRAKRSASS